MAAGQNSIASASDGPDRPAPARGSAVEAQNGAGKEDSSAVTPAVVGDVNSTASGSEKAADSLKPSLKPAVVKPLQSGAVTAETKPTHAVLDKTPPKTDGDNGDVTKATPGKQGDSALHDPPPQPVKTGSAAAILEASKKVVQNAEAWRTSRALVLAIVILAMTTVPALYISLLATKFVVGMAPLESPSRFTVFAFAYAVIKSDLFSLFTVAALPTLTAYFGSSDSKYREGFLPWLLFTYFVLLFVSTFVPEVVANASYAASKLWVSKVEAMGPKVDDINSYLTNVRNSAIAGIAVLTGIKLAS